MRPAEDWFNERIRALGVETKTGDGVPWFRATVFGTPYAELWQPGA